MIWFDNRVPPNGVIFSWTIANHAPIMHLLRVTLKPPWEWVTRLCWPIGHPRPLPSVQISVLLFFCVEFLKQWYYGSIMFYLFADCDIFWYHSSNITSNPTCISMSGNLCIAHFPVVGSSTQPQGQPRYGPSRSGRVPW